MKVIILVVSVAVLCLGIVKVDNELKMTRAYERQAIALERIAAMVERRHHAMNDYHIELPAAMVGL